MCRRSGCDKFAHQYCQDQWGRSNSVQPYNVLYALCREHHLQYCRFIEEIRDDAADNEKDIVVISSEAKGELKNSNDKSVEHEQQEEEYFDVNDTEEKSNDGDDVDDEMGDPTYQPGSDMLEFDLTQFMKAWTVTTKALLRMGKKGRQASRPRKKAKASPKNTTTEVQSDPM